MTQPKLVLRICETCGRPFGARAVDVCQGFGRGHRRRGRMARMSSSRACPAELTGRPAEAVAVTRLSGNLILMSDMRRRRWTSP